MYSRASLLQIMYLHFTSCLRVSNHANILYSFLSISSPYEINHHTPPHPLTACSNEEYDQRVIMNQPEDERVLYIKDVKTTCDHIWILQIVKTQNEMMDFLDGNHTGNKSYMFEVLRYSWTGELIDRFQLMDGCYGNTSIILTSNRVLPDWLDVFPDQVIGGAILDRLAHNAHQITLKGESVRKKLRLKNNQFSPLEPTEKQPKLNRSTPNKGGEYY